MRKTRKLGQACVLMVSLDHINQTKVQKLINVSFLSTTFNYANNPLHYNDRYLISAPEERQIKPNWTEESPAHLQHRMHYFYLQCFLFRQKPQDDSRSLHSVVGLPVLQGLSLLPLLLRFVLQVVPLLQVAQHQAVQDVLVGLLDQLLEQPQRHDADLKTRKIRFTWQGSRRLLL